MVLLFFFLRGLVALVDGTTSSTVGKVLVMRCYCQLPRSSWTADPTSLGHGAAKRDVVFAGGTVVLERRGMMFCSKSKKSDGIELNVLLSCIRSLLFPYLVP